ncbi:quinon protein alcohol dehydrogenase-like superfamily [Thelonectria olida]|uniref:Quinon protein alcohol dehydrogenase-like superfamily n=1 Tax=Thelonectria olida TaxID=1576542 RepID=A0A9P8VSS5_9HYPO|nr:quinon protein alcohol dehydrogenase-like superfamily [Thelonectria olida]
MATLAGNSFNAPIEGHTVIAGNNVTGGTVTFNLNSFPSPSGLLSIHMTKNTMRLVCRTPESTSSARYTPGSTTPDAKAIFWLNGMAGTGKSTVSRTIARDLHQAKRLGASFFFKRGETDRGSMSKFIPTLAGQLIVAEPALARHVKSAVDSDPGIFGKRLQVQFEELIVQPLSRLHNAQATTIVMVIDALDECERDDDVKVVINLFTRFNKLRSPSCRVFLTSRPELPIRLGFNSIRGTYQDLVLHELPQDVIEHDISTYLKQQLSVIRSDYNLSVRQSRHLASDWPGDSNLQHLAQMAVPLFIFAATICRFIGDRRLGIPTGRHIPASLGEASCRIVREATRESGSEIQKVVGSIVNLAAPLSISALEEILETSSADINNLLDMLHSVIDIPTMETHPVRILHLSFRDFLIDPEKCDTSRFWVDEKKAHNEIGIGCLRIMERRLREDVCHLRLPGTKRWSLNPEIIHRYLPSEVKYAVLYWVYHVRGAKMTIHDEGLIGIFLREHFLHWLEALSLIGRIMELPEMIRSFLSLLNSTDSPKLFAFMTDGAQFARSNLAVFDEAPLQVYSSAIAFAPESNIVRQTFKARLPPWILLAPEPEADWDHCHLILETQGQASTILFSSNSQILASVARPSRTIQSQPIELWRVDSGQRLDAFDLHYELRLIGFSPNSKRFAAVADDQLTIWDIDTADCIDKRTCDHAELGAGTVPPLKPLEVALCVGNGPLRGWTVTRPRFFGPPLALGFSPHCKTVLSARAFGEDIYHWSVETGNCIGRFKLDGVLSSWNHIAGLAFSPNSMPLVAIRNSHRRGVQLLRLDTRESIQNFQNDMRTIEDVIFTSDLNLMGSTSDEETVQVWRVDTGRCVKILEGHGDENYPNSVAFSPNSNVMASTFADSTLRVWSLETDGETRQILRHDSRVRSVKFSPDLRHVVSVCADGSIRLWRTDTAKNTHRFRIGYGYEGISEAEPSSHRIL